MGKKKAIFLIVFFMALSILVPRIDVSAATSDLQILFNNTGNTVTSNNTIYANFKVVNNGTSSMNLADLKFRYFYTADSDKAQNFFCDHAGMMNGWSYTGVTDKVTGTFVKMDATNPKADTYLEVGFKSDAGTLSAGGYIEIQTRVARNDWTNYDLSNDYSFKTLSTYGENEKIVAYLSGILIYGQGITIQPPTIMPTVATYDKYASTDLSVTITPNGNTFKGITGLTRNTDYIVSGNTVTILKDCINNLPIGAKVLTFDFGVTNNPKLTLTVKDTTPKPLFDATIGTATGTPGDTVTVPVSFKNVAKAGNIGTCNFYIDYDETLLEGLKVVPGSIVTNPAINFSSKVDATKGKISFVFLDNTIGDEMIKTDGDFALITFRIKTTARETTTPVKFDDDGAYALPTATLKSMANTYNGSVLIKQYLKPILNMNTANVKMDDTTDIEVNLTPNGHTFMGITGLTEGVDYTVSGFKVTILRSYINKIPTDTKVLTFDFGVEDNPVLQIILERNPLSCMNVKIGTVVGALGDIVTVPVTVSSARYVGGIGTFNFYVGYDKTLLEAVSIEPGNVITNPNINFASKIDSNTGMVSVIFLDNTIGDEIIASDGILANIKFKVLKAENTTIPIVFKNGAAFGDRNMLKITAVSFTNGSITIPKTNMLDLSVGKVTGNEGEIVKVPISFANVAKMGNVMSCDFKVNYDTNLLDAVSVEPGSIVKNAEDNFSTYINTTNGAISFLFLDSTEESQPISEDGVFANINFKLKAPTASQIITPVQIKEIGAFIDLNFELLPVLKTNGSVTIIRTTVLESKIEPSKVSFILCGIDSLKITLSPNGNTFNGISGLKSGTDYTVSGNTVTLLKSYINSLEVGTKKLTFDFGTGDKNPVLELAVKAGTPTITPNSKEVYINAATNLIVNTTPNGNPFKGIAGLKEVTDYTVSGNTVTILKSYLDSLQAGIKKLTFDFGIGDKNPVLDIVVKAGTPAITPNYFGVYVKAPKDLIVNITPYGNPFKGIVGLKEGTDYTVSGNTVTILKEYLSKLSLDKTELTFDFGVAENPVLEIYLDQEYCYFTNARIRTAKGSTGEFVTVPVTLSNVSMVNSIGTFNFYVNYDKTLLEAVSVKPGDIITNPNINFSGKINSNTGNISIVFLDNTIGDELIKTDGVLTNITFKILGTTDTITPVVFGGNAFGNGAFTRINDFKLYNGSVTIDNKRLDVSVGQATGKAGDIVTVPINFDNVAKMGNVMSCDFKVNYDTTLLEAVSVEPGSIVTNAEANFESYINTTGGAISLLFLDSTVKSEAICENGVFANIKFKVKTSAEDKIITPVTITEVGTFGAPNFSNIPFITTNGSVTIMPIILPVSYINPTMSSFVLGNVEDLYIALSPNGNTFNGISELRLGTDYTVNGDTVRIMKGYLNSLDAGTKKLTFDFETGDINPVLEITAFVGNPTVIANNTRVNLNDPKDVVVNITTNGNPFNGIIGLKEDTDYIVSGSTVTILTSYLSSLERGKKVLTIDFGLAKNPEIGLQIFDATVDFPLYVRVGNATGVAGETISIPVTFANVTKVGNVGVCNFYIGYDNARLEALSVTVGNIVKNPAVNFATKIDATKGKISFIFLDGTLGDELITQDGVFANINFKVRGNGFTSSDPFIKYIEIGAFGDATCEDEILNVVPVIDKTY